MVCTECGARLTQDDQFCPKCGARVIKKRKCPDCGATLREDNRFCPKCGRLVGEKKKKEVSQDTMDIPMEAIERNILSETAAEIRTDRRRESTVQKEAAPRKKPAAGEERGERVSRESHRERGVSGGHEHRGSEGRERPAQRPAEKRKADSAPPEKRKTSPASAEKRKTDSALPEKRKTSSVPPEKRKANPAPPPKKKRPVYREEPEDDWEEDDWEDDDWDDDDDEGIDIFSIVTVAVGCVLLVIVAFLAFKLYQRYMPKNYEKAAKKQEEEQAEEQEEEGGQEEEQGEEPQQDSEEESAMGTLTIIKNVNVRDNPSTDGTNVIKVAKAGESYEYTEAIDDGEWYKILLPDEEEYEEGYVFSEYVTIE